MPRPTTNAKDAQDWDDQQPQGPSHGASQGDHRPVPDPTTLTTQLLRRELLALKEVLEAKMDGTDKLVCELGKRIKDVVDEIDRRVTAVERLQNEKFAGVQTQFSEKDKALNAALQAAKEAGTKQNESNTLAADKSEANTTKQIDQLGQILQSEIRSINGKIDDVKNTVLLITGKTTGQEGARERNQFGISQAIVIALGLLGFGVAIALAIVFRK